MAGVGPLSTPDGGLELRRVLATAALSRLARYRSSHSQSAALWRWRKAVSEIYSFERHILPLLESRSHAVLTLQPAREEYVAFGEEDLDDERTMELAVLRRELSSLDSEAANSPGHLPLCDSADEVTLGSDEPKGLRSPTPTEVSEATTQSHRWTPLRLDSRECLSLKQLSEGSRALQAAVEREQRRAAEAVRFQSKVNRLERRLELQGMELEAARAQLPRRAGSGLTGE